MTIDIGAVVDDARLAPSGENCQPWHFHRVSDTSLEIRNDPSADRSLYNSRQKGSHVSLGAAVENAVISASTQGYRADVTIEGGEEARALLTFTPGVEADCLAPYLKERCTNRKPYDGRQLSGEEKSKLIAAAKERGAELRIIDRPAEMRSAAGAIAINERVLFENKEVHDFFYSHLLWRRDDQATRSGFFVDTLEFLPHQLKAVKVLRSWWVLRILNMLIGVGKKIASENAHKYAASGSFVAVVMPHSDDAFIAGGRAMERVWLTASSLGLSAHPCTGTLFFMEQIRDGGAEHFSADHQRLIHDGSELLSQLFHAEGAVIPMLWRIGRSDPPTARASRKKLTI